MPARRKSAPAAVFPMEVTGEVTVHANSAGLGAGSRPASKPLPPATRRSLGFGMDTELERFKTEIDLRGWAAPLGLALNARESWRGFREAVRHGGFTASRRTFTRTLTRLSTLEDQDDGVAAALQRPIP
jgi:hypothetical protein